MKQKSLVAAVAVAISAAFIGTASAAEVEVLHYWTSGGEAKSVAELIMFYDDKIAKWQVPDDVQFVDAIPLGATGKMMKAKLREQFKDYSLPA